VLQGCGEGSFAVARTLDDFSRELSLGLLLVSLMELRRAIDQLLLDVAVWRVESAQLQLGGQIVHNSFVRSTFTSQPSSDCKNPFGVQPSDVEVSEATPANQVILPLLHALVLEERIDNRLGAPFARIILHVAHPSSPSHRPALSAGFAVFTEACTSSEGALPDGQASPTLEPAPPLRR